MDDLKGAHHILPQERQCKVPYSRLKLMRKRMEKFVVIEAKPKVPTPKLNRHSITIQSSILEQLIQLNRLALSLQETPISTLRSHSYAELKQIQSLCIHGTNGLTNFEEMLRISLS